MHPAILIAEDHSVVRLGTRMLLQEVYSNITIEEASSFYEVLHKLDAVRFDMIILDIQIPGGDSLKMIEIIKLRQPGIRILVFSAYEEKLFAPSYIRAGALGYIQKDVDHEIFKLAVKKVINNEPYFSDDIQKLLFDSWIYEKRVVPTGIKSLSSRELEVMNLLIKGHSTSEIRAILNIQPSTISTHKEKIYSKMNVSNVIELAQIVKHEIDNTSSAS